jgi:hypothetical protein
VMRPMTRVGSRCVIFFNMLLLITPNQLPLMSVQMCATRKS